MYNSHILNLLNEWSYIPYHDISLKVLLNKYTLQKSRNFQNFNKKLEIHSALLVNIYIQFLVIEISNKINRIPQIV